MFENVTRRDLLRYGVEEQTFNRIVRLLSEGKGYTRQQAEQIAKRILEERRRNYVALEEYFDSLEAKEYQERQKRILRAKAQRQKINRELMDRIRRDREAIQAQIQRERMLKERFREQLNREQQQKLIYSADFARHELARFEGMVNAFIEPLKYGISQAEKMTGKPRRMFLNQREALIQMLSEWFSRMSRFLSPDDIRKYRELIDKLTSVRI